MSEAMRKGYLFYAFLGTLLFLSIAATAQPNLTFKRITVNWPTIEVYFAVGCEGAPAYHMAKQDFRIRENGEEVKDFTLWCTDPRQRAANAVSLVVDVSGSMRGEALNVAKHFIEAWSKIMEPGMDQAALISAGTTPVVEQMMTTDASALQEAVGRLRVRGSSGWINGISHGIDHNVRYAINPCRAVIVLSDGRDNHSNMTAAEVIAQAQRERIRVFTVGVGPVVEGVTLEMIALLTGGRYLQNPTAGQLVAIYQELNCIMYPGYQECVITYEHTGCADGSMRTVDLRLRNICDGEDEKSRTYRAPLDSTDFIRQQLRIGTTVSEPADIVTVPLLLDWMPPDSTLHPFSTTIFSGEPRRPLLGVRIPKGSPLEGAAFDAEAYPDSVRLRLTEALPVRAADVLCELRFGTAGIFDSAFFPLQALFQPTGQRCVVNLIQPGGYTIAPNLRPAITPAGEVRICAEGVTLTANDGFSSYRWSTGDSTRAIHVIAAGRYAVEVTNARGDTLRSPATVVLPYPRRVLRVAAQGPLEVCNGERVRLALEGDMENEDVLWNGQWKRDELEVGWSGAYWAEIVDSNGCRHSSDTVQITVRRPPVELNIPTNMSACENDTLELRVLQPYPEYHWSTGETTQSIRIEAKPERYPRTYTVWVRDSNGCRSDDRYAHVFVHRERELTLQPGEKVVLCGDGQAVVSPVEQFSAWRWSTGDTTRALTIRAPGTYILTATDSNGCSAAATVVAEHIDAAAAPRIRAPGFRLCAGESIALDGGAEYAAWRWSTGDTTRFLLVEYPGSYFADVTSYGGCTRRTDTVTVREESVPDVSIVMEGDGVICAGDSLRLSAPPGYAQYYWTTGESTREISVRTAGRYAVSVISAGGCENTSPSVRITVDEPQRPHLVNWGDFLFTNTEAVSYQWYLDGAPIPGETTSSMHAPRSGRYLVEIIDSCGRVLRSEEVTVTVAAAQSPAPASLHVDTYPEPVRDRLHVYVRGSVSPVKLALCDVFGRPLMQRIVTADGVQVLDVAALPPTVYYLRISSPRGTTVRRMLKR
jgi:Mg-chelatase subunit ChlD